MKRFSCLCFSVKRGHPRQPDVMMDSSKAASPMGTMAPSKFRKRKFTPDEQPVSNKEVLKEDTRRLMKREEERTKTFDKWPAWAKISPAELVKAGFYYLGARDQVKCAFCHIKLQDWCPGDVPLEEHKKLFPTCSFVQGLNVGVHAGEQERGAEDKLEGKVPKQKDQETIAHNQMHHHLHHKQKQHQQEEEQQQCPLYTHPQQQQQEQQQCQQPSPMLVERGYPGQNTSLHGSGLMTDETEKKEVWTRNKTENANNGHNSHAAIEADSSPFSPSSQSLKCITPQTPPATGVSSEQEQDDRAGASGKSEVLKETTGQLMMQQDEERTKTFHNWPAWAKISPAELVKAGFFYLGARDQVKCAFCHKKLQDWCRGDVPLDEHKKLFPTCPFIQGLDVGVHTGEEEPRAAEDRLEGDMSKQRDPVTLPQNQHHHHPHDKQKQPQQEHPHSQRQQEQEQKHQHEQNYDCMQPLQQEQQQQQQQQQQKLSIQQQQQQPSPMRVEQGDPGQECSLQGSSMAADATVKKEVWMRNTTEDANTERILHGAIEADSSSYSLSNHSLTRISPHIPAAIEISAMEWSEETPDDGRTSGGAGTEHRDHQHRVETRISDTQLQKVVDMGFNIELVHEVMRRNLPTTGECFSNVQDLVEAILAEQYNPGQVEPGTQARYHQNRPDDDENQQLQHLQLHLPLHLQQQQQQQQEEIQLQQFQMQQLHLQHQQQQMQQQQDISLQQLQIRQQHQQQPNPARMAQGSLGQDRSSMGSAAIGTTSEGKKGKKGSKKKGDPYAEVAAGLSWDSSTPNNNPSKDSMQARTASSTGTTNIPDEVAEALREENEKLRQQRVCKVCLVKEECIVFQPCGHLVCCASCAFKIDRCAVCRAVITKRVRAFMS